MKASRSGDATTLPHSSIFFKSAGPDPRMSAANQLAALAAVLLDRGHLPMALSCLIQRGAFSLHSWPRSRWPDRGKPSVSARAETAQEPGTGFRAGPEASSQVYINQQLTLSVPGEAGGASARCRSAASSCAPRPRWPFCATCSPSGLCTLPPACFWSYAQHWHIRTGCSE